MFGVIMFFFFLSSVLAVLYSLKPFFGVPLAVKQICGLQSAVRFDLHLQPED